MQYMAISYIKYDYETMVVTVYSDQMILDMVLDDCLVWGIPYDQGLIWSQMVLSSM